jgi:hypothetical protein
MDNDPQFLRGNGRICDQSPWKKFIPGSLQPSITARGSLFLAKYGGLPELSEKRIVDKSKADNVAKCLVCIQVGWFFVELIGRVVKRLHVTFLEFHLRQFGKYLIGE